MLVFTRFLELLVVTSFVVWEKEDGELTEAADTVELGEWDCVEPLPETVDTFNAFACLAYVLVISGGCRVVELGDEEGEAVEHCEPPLLLVDEDDDVLREFMAAAAVAAATYA